MNKVYIIIAVCAAAAVGYFVFQRKKTEELTEQGVITTTPETLDFSQKTLSTTPTTGGPSPVVNSTTPRLEIVADSKGIQEALERNQRLEEKINRINAKAAPVFETIDLMKKLQ